MAKKTTTPVKKQKKTSHGSKVTAITPVRHTAVPRRTVKRASANGAHAAPKHITRELIAQRAYFISMSGTGGSQDENWHRAERELRAGI